MRRSLLVLAPFAVLAAPAAAASGTRIYDEADTTASIVCTRSLTSVVVNGAASTIRVRGRCRSITVNGASVRVTADVVDRITVNGSNSRVSYRKSRSGGRAIVSTSASGAKVTRR